MASSSSTVVVMTLSPDTAVGFASGSSPNVLRGADFSRLPVVTLVPGGSRPGESRPADARDGDARSTQHRPNQSAEQDRQQELFQRGWDEGQAAVRAEFETEKRNVLGALEAAIEGIEHRKQQWVETVPRHAADLALEITEMIMMRELSTSVDPGRDAIIRCFDQLALSDQLVVRLNPSDLEQLGSTDFLSGRTIELVADPGLRSGDAVADFGGGSVDATLSAALERVTEVLRS